MIERRAQPKGSSEPRKSPGLVTQLTMKRSPRGIPGPPSVSGLASRPIKSEPRGYRTGSMCVTSSGSMPDVIATPSVKSTVLLREVAPTIASLFGQVEVVLVQRVLGVVAAADHASSAKHTSRPRRTLAAEVGVGDLLSRLAEKDGDVGSPESSALADLLRALPQDSIGLGEPWIGRGAQHPLCRDVVRCERLFPVPA